MVRTLQIMQYELGNIRAGEADVLVNTGFKEYWVLDFWKAAPMDRAGSAGGRGGAGGDPRTARLTARGGRMKALALVVSLLALGIGGPVRAASLAGVELPDTETVNGTRLVLNGMGLRQATVLRVKAYVGGLYLEKRSSDPDIVINSRQCKRVTMVFLRDIDGTRLASGWADELRKVGGTEASIARFTALIGDVQKGDRMSFTWCPDAGVEVAAGGTVRGTAPGDDFARTLFTIWFGPDPGDANLKRGMLGK